MPHERRGGTQGSSISSFRENGCALEHHPHWGVFQLHIISLVPMREEGGHILKDFKGEEEKRKRKTGMDTKT